VTVLVGVRCSDGVVIGADGIATAAMGQFPLIHLEANPKIEIFGDRVIVATTGSVGYSQRLCHHIGAALDGGVFNNFNAREATNNISKRMIDEWQSSKAPTWPQDGWRFGCLMAAAVKDGPFLAEFSTIDFQAELKVGRIFFGSM
jgi:20S proteasome alpha/beta subunit